MGGLVSLGATAEPVTVHGMELRNRMSIEGVEHYDHLWNKLIENGVDAKVSMSSLSRVLANFSEGDSSCLFPTGSRALLPILPNLKGKIIESDVVDVGGMALVSRADHEAIKGVADLKGKRISMRNALDEKLFLPGLEAASIEKVSHDLSQLQLLDRGRIDAALVFTPDVYIAAEKMTLLPESSILGGAY